MCVPSSFLEQCVVVLCIVLRLWPKFNPGVWVWKHDSRVGILVAFIRIVIASSSDKLSFSDTAFGRLCVMAFNSRWTRLTKVA